MSRKHRRVFRPSTAEDYDRTADKPESTVSSDEVRDVILDPDMEDASEGNQFLVEQRPPHHGAE